VDERPEDPLKFILEQLQKSEDTAHQVEEKPKKVEKS